MTVSTAAIADGPAPQATGGNAPAALPASIDTSWFAATNFSSDGYELRGGVFAHDVGGAEQGTVSLNGDFVFKKFWAPDLGADLNFLVPRLQVGAMVNTDGKTSYASVGLLWTYNFTNRFFSELSFGAAVQDGYLDTAPPGRQAIGCRVEYNPGLSFGLHVTPQWSVMASFDHVSNGEPTLSSCGRNQGLNELGLRAGYAF